MNGIYRIETTKANPAFRANYNLFKIKLKMKQLTNPMQNSVTKTIDRLEGKRVAETCIEAKASKETLANLVRDMWTNEDYYILEGFNKGLGKIAADVYKLL